MIVNDIFYFYLMEGISYLLRTIGPNIYQNKIVRAIKVFDIVSSLR